MTLTIPSEPRDDADRYVAFLGESPTPAHAVVAVTNRLESAGFVARDAAEPLDPKQGERIYVVAPDGRTVLAAVIGSRAPALTGFSIWGAHTDSPDLRLRLNPVRSEAGTVQLLTQVHGGIIRRAWLDRPLMLAGALFHLLRDKSGAPRFHPTTGKPMVQRSLVHLPRPLAVIPDLAIHLDREKNDKGAINPETALNAVFATGQAVEEAVAALSLELGVPLADVDGFDLHLVPWQPATRVGVDGSMIFGPRHDDLAMVYAGVAGLVAAVEANPAPAHTAVGAFFDAEETGSQTSSGAQSAFLRDVLTRLCAQHPETPAGADAAQAFARSLVLSGDMAHALHPNHTDKHDRAHAPLINQGLVVKVNTNDRYASSGATIAAFRALCEAADVPLQAYVHRQDAACGSTIGPITAANLGAPTVDFGAPMWAMHSTGETMGALDMAYAVRLATTFFAGGRG